MQFGAESVDISFDRLFGPIVDHLNTFIPLIPNAIATGLVGFVFIRLISWMAYWMLGFVRMPKGLRGIIISLIDAILGIFLIIIVLQALGLGSLALVLTAGVAAAGIAIGNGSVTMIADIIAGIYLARDRDFAVGDIVRAGEEKTEGEILSMDMRRTRIKSTDGRIHSMPNSVIERKEYVLITKKRDRKA